MILLVSHSEQDAQKRAEHVLANCRQMGIDCAHLPEDLLCGNKYLSQIFVAQLFWHDNCLTVSDAEGVEANVEQYEDRDEGSREERAFRYPVSSHALLCTPQKSMGSVVDACKLHPVY